MAVPFLFGNEIGGIRRDYLDANFAAASQGGTVSTAFATLALAVAAAAGGTLYVVGAYTTATAIPVASGTRIVMMAGSSLTVTASDVSGFVANGVANVVIEGPGRISSNVSGTTLVSGLVRFANAAFCHVVGVEFSGGQWSGVFIDQGSIGCTARYNRFRNWGAIYQDSNAVAFYGNVSGCQAIGNYIDCPTMDHGVLVQDPYAGTLPSRNVVLCNRIFNVRSYGLLCYQPGTAGQGDTWNQFVANHVEGVTGAGVGGAGGAGIYVVGAWAGGTLIANNTFHNCCTATTLATLTPAAIGINGISALTSPVDVIGNHITGMTQGHGIFASGSNVNIVGGSIRMPAANNGTGPGGAGLLGSGIQGIQSSMQIVDPDIAVLGTGNAIFSYATGATVDALSINGGQLVSATTDCLSLAQNGGFLHTNVSIRTRCKVTGATGIGVRLQNVDSGIVDCVSTGGAFTLLLNASPRLRIGGRLSGAATGSINIAGTCTESVLSMDFGGNPAGVVNGAGSGARIYWDSNSSPASGTWAVGDKVLQSAPVVGNPKGWRCTVAGAPGTWISEGNL